MQRSFHVLTGPTAAGKSGFLLDGCTQRQMLVISADSRQIYRLMDIGTGKPSAAEIALLPHYGVNFLELGTKFSVYQYLIMLADCLKELAGDPREVWICGGTGLYIHALLNRLQLGQPPRAALRRRLTELMALDGAAHWSDRLGLQLRDPHNPMRVLRAAEALCADSASTARLYASIKLDPNGDDVNAESDKAAFQAAMAVLQDWQCAGLAVLDPGRDELLGRIDKRVRQMFESGLPEEVQQIREAGYGAVDEVANGIAYREAGLLLDGELSYEEAVERSIIRTRQYAKRQRTYFRGKGWQFMQEDELAQWFSGLR